MLTIHLLETRWKCLRVLGVVLGVVASIAATSQAGVMSFGAGVNAFQMEFVGIGNPGNLADTTGTPSPSGAVGYEFGIGKFEVSEDMINKFNASQSLQITKDSRGTNKPATHITWNEAARFVNWLNTSTGGFNAYKFTTGGVNDNIALWTAADTLDYVAANPYRSMTGPWGQSMGDGGPWDRSLGTVLGDGRSLGTEHNGSLGTEHKT